MTDILPVWNGEPRMLCGVLVDPKKFIPQYLYRFLLLQEWNGNPVPPGSYSIELKVNTTY